MTTTPNINLFHYANKTNTLVYFRFGRPQLGAIILDEDDDTGLQIFYFVPRANFNIYLLAEEDGNERIYKRLRRPIDAEDVIAVRYV